MPRVQERLHELNEATLEVRRLRDVSPYAARSRITRSWL